MGITVAKLIEKLQRFPQDALIRPDISVMAIQPSRDAQPGDPEYDVHYRIVLPDHSRPVYVEVRLPSDS